MRSAWWFVLMSALLLSCDDNNNNKPEPDPDPGALKFGPLGSLSQPSGKGSFRFGAATAAAQIEDGLDKNDWHFWTLPEAEGGLGKGKAFVADAVRGKSKAIEDVEMIRQMNLDAYRFSVDWSRIEPARDQVSEEGLKHYDGVLDELVKSKIHPMITVHHFSSPIWVDDFRQPRCKDEAEPTDENLCGWGHPKGAELIIEELAEHAALLAKRYGDRVDEWCTLNEPINYLIASYGSGFFPPGPLYLLTDFERLVNIFRFYLRAHVAIYDAIKANDTVDADGDGVAADVGFSLSVAYFTPSRDNKPSEVEADIAARDAVWYVYHHLYADALIQGGFDADLDGAIDEQHPEWKGKLDWLGLQYYFRTGVTGKRGLIRQLGATPCFGSINQGACLEPEDPTHWVPSMAYEYWAPGLYELIKDFSARYPSLPLVITEAGIAAKNGKRRAENVVRTLEQIKRASDEGADVRGYYHWSLMDNFEWAEGYEPHFGLYRVDLTTYERAPTEGATVYGEIAKTRRVSSTQQATFGGLGPMSPESEE